MAKGCQIGGAFVSKIILPGSLPESTKGKQRHEHELEMMTRKRSHIENVQCHDRIGNFEKKAVEDIDREYEGRARKRTGATALYNCHGLTFASRRTRILSDETLKQILKEDGYAEVEPKSVIAGDIVLYFNESGGIDHSGMVVCNPMTDLISSQPMVLSKWGSGPEYVHPALVCPYPISDIKYYRCEKCY